MDKEQILNAIKNAAEANGGVAPGKTKFFQLTGIKESDWVGKFWVRWSEALEEAGLTPNKMQGAFSDEHILESYALLVRKLNHVPTSVELRMHARNTAEFPSHNTFNRFGSKARLIGKLIDYCENIGNHEDILPLLKETRHELPSDLPEPESKEPEEGYVYLMKFGNEFKIGTSNNVERRFRELKTQMPYEGQIVHTIITGDPEGIEAYWHQYFAGKRLKGEWFKLDSKDIRYFKKRKLM